MCGRYSWAQKKVSTQFKKLEIPPPPTSVSYNRSPGQEHPVIIKTTKKTDWSNPDSTQLMRVLKRFVKNQFFRISFSIVDASYRQTVISNGKKLNLRNTHIFTTLAIYICLQWQVFGTKHKKRMGAYDHSQYLPNPLHQIYFISIIACQL